jgi:hypothetical protein
MLLAFAAGDYRLQSLSRTTNFAARFFSSGNVVTSAMPTHAEKAGAGRIIAAFCPRVVLQLVKGD